MTRLIFDGGSGEVTGSMHILEHRGRYIALDCGLYQGRRAETNAKNRSFAIDPKKIDTVILSHAHIDHSGRLPRLVRQGFRGTIYGTPATRDLAAILLADSAHIQEEDADFYNRKRLKPGERPVKPLYTIDDAVATMRRFVAVPYLRQIDLGDGIKFRFHDAGHILGSAIVSVEVNGGGKRVRLAFSGDLGRPGLPILRDPTPLPDCDHLIIESTYGARVHENPEYMKEKLREQILLTVERSGKVIIPAFSVGRTQTLVYFLSQLMHENALPDIPVFVDSPLATDATEIFRSHPECFDGEATVWLRTLGDIMGTGCCQFTRSTEASKRLNRRRKPCVIIAASGMCEAGRILHHLVHGVGNERNTILIVGFQAAHTLGRRIVEREPRIRIFGRMYRLKARVKTLNGFSSHADSKELADWLEPGADRIKQVFVVHGEEDQSQALAETLDGRGYKNVLRPTPGQQFALE